MKQSGVVWCATDGEACGRRLGWKRSNSGGDRYAILLLINVALEITYVY